MAIFASYKLPLLAAAALVAPTAAVAQDPGTRIIVTGAMQDPGTRITVVGAMQDPGTRITVIGAMQDPGTRITVIGAAKERARARTGENPADRAIPSLPIVYEDESAAQASAPAAPPTGKAPPAPSPTGR